MAVAGLVGHERLRGIIARLHTALRAVCRLDLRIHTNGVRLDEQFCELFAQIGVKVGVSLDGDRAANDRHRGTQTAGAARTRWSRPSNCCGPTASVTCSPDSVHDRRGQ